MRVRDDSGDWKPVDYDLVRTSDGFAPKESPSDVSFSAGGTGPAAVINKGTKSLTLGWLKRLPAPTISGNTATYQLDASTQLVMAATADGMEESLVLSQAPADPAALAKLRFEMKMTHLSTADNGHKSGQVELANGAGNTAITVNPVTVYDAQVAPENDGGEHTHTLQIPSTVTTGDTTSSTGGDTTSDTGTGADAGDQMLGFDNAQGEVPDALTSYLNDPATVYPVTIDPTVTTTTPVIRNTWIEGGDTTNHAYDAKMSIGDDGGHKRRALMHFDATVFPTNVHIISSTLNLYEPGAKTCTAEPLVAMPITTNWTSPLIWSNQPSVTSTDEATASFSHGASSSCPNAWGTINITAMTQAWVNGTIGNRGLLIRAGDETAAVQDKTFCTLLPDKSESTCNANSKTPTLKINYDRPPATPAAPALSTSPVSSAGYSVSTTPKLTTSVSDADGNAHAVITVKNSAGTAVWSYTSATVNGTYSPVVAAGKLTNGATYTATAQVTDGYYTKTSAATTFTVDTTPPTTSVTATHYTTGQWNTAAPTSDTFTLKGSADTKSFAYSLNGAAAKAVAANSAGAASFTWTPVNGPNTIAVTATDKAGNTGKSLLGFGTGPAGITHLVDHPVSTGTFPLQASGPGGATGTAISWRFAGATAWTPIDSTTLTQAADGSSWNGTPAATTIASGTTAASVTPALMWDATAQSYTGPDDKPVNLKAPALLDLQVCFTYTGGTKLCAVENGAQLVPSAFGGNFPTTDMGPAQVALTTGEMALSESDAADQSAGMGRTFSSYDPGTIADGPFGPGWSASLGASSDSGATLVDDRAQDGTFVLVTAGDASQTFTATDGKEATTPGNYPDGVTFAPLGVDDQTRLQLSHDGQTVTLTHPQEESSTWTYNTDDASWEFQGSQDQTSDDQTTVTYDQGHPAWIAETNAGDTAACTPADQEPGCRALRVNYTGTGTATRATSVDLITGAAGGTGTVTRQATYTFTGTGASALLTKVCGPDPDDTGAQTPLCETYTYDTTTVPGRTLLATLTPPGEATWTFTYDNQGRLAKVTRPQDSDAGGGTATWSTDYDVNPTGTGLPDLSAAAAAVWGQTDDLATHGYAAFDPSYVPSSTPTSDDLKHASLWYTDAEGNTTNTATYGTVTDTTNDTDGTPTSRWLVDATTYDHDGNVTATIDPAGIIAAQDTQAGAVAGGASADDALALGQGVASDRSSYTIYSGDGSRVSDEYGPAHTAYLKGSETPGTYRTHTHYVYDDQAPDLGGVAAKPKYDTTPDPDTGVAQTTFNLVVETDTSAADPDMNPDGSGDHDTVVTRNNYAPLVSTDENGWTLGEPTQTSISKRQPDGSDGPFTVTSTTRYDTDGNTIESRQPGGSTDSTGAGNDAHATTTSYYTKTNTDPDCQINGHPDRAGWENLTCKTGPAKQPTDPADSGITQHLPVTWDKTYDIELQPTLVVETSGSTTRTTTTVYDGLERPTQITVDDGHDKRVQNYAYDPKSGQQTTIDGAGSTSVVGGTVTTGYDSWGRVDSYTDGTGNLTQTSYTADGQTAETTDPNGTTTYKHAADGTDALTSMTTSAGTGNTTFTVGYDADGNPLRVGYGDAITATYGYDEAGNSTSLDYQNSAGDDLAGFSNNLDVNGSVQEANSTASAATQDYTYDVQHRLTNVQDTRDDACTTRAYGFDATSDRTSLNTYGAADDGSCQTTTTTSSRSWSYDDGNRVTNGGYTYDNLGRTLTVPAADTNAAADTGAGALQVGYYANDMAASLTQTITGPDGVTAETDQNTFGLDATGRINQITTNSNGVEKTKETYEFGDDSDSPTAISTYTAALNGQAATTTLNRYVTLDDLGMVASIDSTGVSYQLTNLHGDTVAAADNTGTIGSYSETDEYGNPYAPRNANLTAGAGRYGYLGSAQRSSGMVGGLTLMGSRLFDSVTGQFLSIDRILGGTPTRYAYPEDPINCFDSNGQWSIGKLIHKVSAAVIKAAKAALVWGLQKGLTWGLSALICEEAAVVCKAMISGATAFTVTLLKDVFYYDMHVSSSLAGASTSGYSAFVGALVTANRAPSLKQIRSVLTGFRSFLNWASSWLRQHGHAYTAMGIISGGNAVVNKILATYG